MTTDKVGPKLLLLAASVALIGAACGGGSQSLDAGSPGMCGADVPAGQQCNAVQNVGATVTPACLSDTLPAGTGGTIVAGTYVLTSRIYYNSTDCQTSGLSETIVIAGDCLQGVLGGMASGTASSRLATQGNTISFTSTCTHSDIDASSSADTRTKTYSATSSTLTLFAQNAPSGGTTSGDVAVFTRR